MISGIQPRRLGTLTIGQLAAYTAVTVRAIRFYHQRGLHPEFCRTYLTPAGRP